MNVTPMKSYGLDVVRYSCHDFRNAVENLCSGVALSDEVDDIANS